LPHLRADNRRGTPGNSASLVVASAADRPKPRVEPSLGYAQDVADHIVGSEIVDQECDRAGHRDDAAVFSECDVEADANGAWAKRSQLVARFKAERIAEGEAVTAHIEEIVDVHG
jgi:hypothetical protein